MTAIFFNNMIPPLCLIMGLTAEHPSPLPSPLLLRIRHLGNIKLAVEKFGEYTTKLIRSLNERVAVAEKSTRFLVDQVGAFGFQFRQRLIEIVHLIRDEKDPLAPLLDELGYFSLAATWTA